MNPTFFLRQLDIADPAKFKDKPITVIGAGGIGAATVVALSKTGFENIAVYDFDTVEEQNIPNQLLPLHSVHSETIGYAKVYALDDLTHQLTGIHIQAHHERYTNQPLGEIVVSAVDSLEARRQIWGQVSQSLDTIFYLDGRMAITSMDLYAIDMLKEEAVVRCEPNLPAPCWDGAPVGAA